MNTHDKKHINELISAFQMLGFKRKEDENFLPIHIGRAICNPFKISYIQKLAFLDLQKADIWNGTPLTKEDKKNLNKDLYISDEIRNKFFKATNIEKFFKLYFEVKTDEENNLFAQIINKFKVKFFGNQNFRMKTFEGENIGKLYAYEHEYKVLRNSSCMQAPEYDVSRYWFEIYEEADVKMIVLHLEKNVVARALLWECKYEDDSSHFYLDRIYICNEFNDEAKQKLQTDLYNKVCNKLNVKFIDCYSRQHILRHLKTKGETQKIKLIENNTKSEPKKNFVVKTNNTGILDNYPYMDTFKYYDYNSRKLYADNNIIENKNIRSYEYLDRTDGHEINSCCDSCGSRFNEEELVYSHLHEENFCEDCRIYLDDRDDYTTEHNATYDNYREVHIYTDDLS